MAEDDMPELLEAARVLDAARVKKLLKSGVPAATADKDKYTALHWISNWQTDETPASIAIAKALLDGGASVDAQDSDGITVLNSAMGGIYGPAREKRKLIRLLLDRSANPNLGNRFGWVPLKDVNHAEVAGWLRKAGAEVDVRDKDGKTPLFEHVDKNRTELVAWCVENGADVNAKDKKGRTPLHLAADNANPAIVKLLLAAGAKPDVKNKEGKTPTQLAPGTGKGKAVAKLLADALAPKPAAKPAKPAPAKKPAKSRR